MKRKAISLLLCAAMVATAAPVFSTSETVSAGAEPILAYMPLDNRPVNVDRVIYEAESAGFKVVMPDADLYTTRLDGQPLNSNGKQFGDSKKLMEWISEMDEVTDYFVISLDQLLSGGLVNSREISKQRYDAEYKMIDAVIDLSKNNHVYIVDTVARLATCTVGYHEATLETYNYLRSYSLVPRKILEGSALNISRIVWGYGKDEGSRDIRVKSGYSKAVKEMLRVRERKLNLIDYMLTKDVSGNIKYFIGVDDSSSENTIQTNEVNYLKKKLDGRGLIYSGTDELGMMAALSLMIDYYGYDVNAAVVYFGDTEQASAGSAYDMETVRDNVNKHLESIGVHLTDTESADIEIAVLTQPEQSILSAKYINRVIDYINGNISKGVPTILINSNPGAYSGNLEFRMIRECEMSMLLSYSSWNTVGNAIGLALCNGVSRFLYLKSRDSSTDTADIAFIKGLAFSYAKDISYQRGGGRTLFNNYLTDNGWDTSNFYQSDEQTAKVNADIEEIFKTTEYNVTVGDIIDNLTGCRYFKGLGGECGIIGKISLTNYSAPFFRSFEIRFDIEVELSDATLSGFTDAFTVKMPYTPEDGQLAYSFTLYFVDDTGKVHEIPCAYDKNTGTVEFLTDKLPRFFTSALTIESDKAYSLYTDVPESSWYFDCVLYVHEKGVMRGTADGLFEPNKTMSRAMLANTIYNMAGMPDFDESKSLPPDVGNRWYKTAVEWVLSSNIAQANSDGGFGPEDPATREQMADMLWRYAVYSGKGAANGSLPGADNYADVFTISPDMREGLDWACSRGIITGSGDERLWPQKATTRAEAAAAIKRFYEKL
ncbi:MAG: DUF4127 family protein [Clostridiales bacterium]|nr:DUF4127 family protein [Clostridiales bacterium]